MGRADLRAVVCRNLHAQVGTLCLALVSCIQGCGAMAQGDEIVDPLLARLETVRSSLAGLLEDIQDILKE